MVSLKIELNKKEFARITELSKLQKKGNSTVARELINIGWEYLMVTLYKEGKLSLGTLSEKLELSMSEIIDRLGEFRVTVLIDYEDYLKGFEYLKRLKER